MAPAVSRPNSLGLLVETWSVLTNTKVSGRSKGATLGGPDDALECDLGERRSVALLAVLIELADPKSQSLRIGGIDDQAGLGCQRSDLLSLESAASLVEGDTALRMQVVVLSPEAPLDEKSALG